jgi:hypothetical protein
MKLSLRIHLGQNLFFANGPHIRNAVGVHHLGQARRGQFGGGGDTSAMVSF